MQLDLIDVWRLVEQAGNQESKMEERVAVAVEEPRVWIELALFDTVHSYLALFCLLGSLFYVVLAGELGADSLLLNLCDLSTKFINNLILLCFCRPIIKFSSLLLGAEANIFLCVHLDGCFGVDLQLLFVVIVLMIRHNHANSSIFPMAHTFNFHVISFIHYTN